jgi:hypothetical protein
MTTLGERVKTERRAKGWSQAELARRVTKAGYSITQGGIAQIERRGDTEPKSIVRMMCSSACCRPEGAQERGRPRARSRGRCWRSFRPPRVATKGR